MNKWIRLKQLFCTHVYDIAQIGSRDETGWLDWPCHKCGKIARVEYGLQVKGKMINSSQEAPNE